MALDLTRNAPAETPAQRYAVDLRLHDETIQALYGVSLRLQAAVDLTNDSSDIRDELEHAVTTIDNVIAGLRERLEDVSADQGDLPPGYA
jgi:hypothetical protein